jgi:hypothetical protein
MRKWIFKISTEGIGETMEDALINAVHSENLMNPDESIEICPKCNMELENCECNIK